VYGNISRRSSKLDYIVYVYIVQLFQILYISKFR